MSNPSLCQKCGGQIRPGVAMAQTFVGGVPDFAGDSHVSTFSAGGPGALTDCLKCDDCGWSVTGRRAMAEGMRIVEKDAPGGP